MILLKGKFLIPKYSALILLQRKRDDFHALTFLGENNLPCQVAIAG